MKVDIKSNESGPMVAPELSFQDKDIHKLSIKEGKRKDIKFKDTNVSYLTGLVLRCFPLRQKKSFYLKYKYKRKSSWLKLNEFVYGHYGTLEVTEELLGLYKKYYDRKLGRWKHDPKEQLITQRELELSQELSVREVIQRQVQAQFPRKV